MTSAAIPRISTVPIITVPDNLDELDEKLSQEAYDYLGYTGGRVTRFMHQIARERKQNLDNLYRTLFNQGIKPLDARAVKKYQNSVLLKTWLKPIAIQIALIMTTVITSNWALTRSGHAEWAVRLTIILSIIGLIGSIITWVKTEPANWDWYEKALNGYNQPIPAHVLSTALIVAKQFKITAYGINVHALKIIEFSKDDIVADPFLVVDMFGERIYLEVWDEPTFRSR